MPISLEYVWGKKKSVTVTTTLSVVFESGNIDDVASAMLWVKNTGSTALSQATVEISPDGVEWYTADTTKFVLGAGGKDFLEVRGASFIRVQMAVVSGTTTVDIGLTVIDTK